MYDTQGSGLLGCPCSISHGPKRLFILFYFIHVPSGSIVLCARLVRSLRFIDITTVYHVSFLFFSFLSMCTRYVAPWILYHNRMATYHTVKYIESAYD